MSKGFASQADLVEKQETFRELAPGVYALTAEGDPNSGVIVGDDSALVIDARATPRMAGDLVARVRAVTDKPIRHVLLTHYHAVRVLGVAGYPDRVNVIASDVARAMIVERGQQDMDSEIQRFPRLFRGKEEIPGLTWPTLTFHREMTLWLGTREVRIIHAGRGHTAGDTIAWLPQEKVLFSGDLVEYGATPYCGDAHFQDWPATLDRLEALKPTALVPGRGEALTTPEQIREGLEGTRAFLRDLYAIAREGVAAGHDLKAVYDRAMSEMRPRYGHWVIFEHCMPFDVSRAYDEAKGLDTPRIWTAERDMEMWRALEG
ncbi:MBL fold metallo-hydrolase [Methylobacterium oryzisoli]|uniref:MBL fold metallo-hydrolase n=1 Tax=Methylobacterium oryzisoli TaxID=3385502 RepID=UPI0038925A1A